MFARRLAAIAVVAAPAIVVAAAVVEVEAGARPLIAEAEIEAAALRLRRRWHGRECAEADKGGKGCGPDEFEHGVFSCHGFGRIPYLMQEATRSRLNLSGTSRSCGVQL